MWKVERTSIMDNLCQLPQICEDAAWNGLDGIFC